MYYFCSWKYWSSAKDHILTLAILTAYDIYKECVTEMLAKAAIGDDKDEVKLLSFLHDFRDKLSEQQGLGYAPTDTLYPGDSATRAVRRLTLAVQK